MGDQFIGLRKENRFSAHNQGKIIQHGTCKITMTFPKQGWSFQRGILSPKLNLAHTLGQPLNPKASLTHTLPCNLNSASPFQREHCFAGVSATGASWDLTRTLTRALALKGPTTDVCKKNRFGFNDQWRISQHGSQTFCHGISRTKLEL